ncbi:MAG: hypothetical protein HY898_16705 [Deltaproteobacteria bacterium]|nr:hypothetical protein [Deltaproteobacteria bacterium]
MRSRIFAFAGLIALLGACTQSKLTATQDAGAASAEPSAAASIPVVATSASPPSATEAELISKRPYRLRTPKGADPAKALPLIVFLHGYGAVPTWFADKTKVDAASDTERFVAAFPDGTADSKGKRFWNATDVCCNFDNAAVDDVAYLRAVIKDASSKARIDPKRIYVLGYDNGGFMAQRAACDLADLVAAVVSIGGAGWADASKCSPKGRISILLVHGEGDQTVPYAGGRVKWSADAPEHPGFRQTAADWAKRNGCGPNTSPMPPVHLDDDLAGSETSVERYNGCERGAVDLWTRKAKKHSVGTGERAIHQYASFLFAHPKP